MTKNEQVCLWLGLNPACHNLESDPGKVQLLREMEKHVDGKLFFARLRYIGDYIEAADDDGVIERDYITDETGKLLTAAYDFLKEKSNE